MTKIAVVGDLHVADRPPASCTERYTEDILSLLQQIADLCRGDAECDAVVLLGDIFHYKTPNRTSHKVTNQLLEIIASFEQEMLVVVGNHDIQNDRLDSLDRQPLGVLLASGKIKALQDTIRTFNGTKLAGVPWQQDWSTIWLPDEMPDLLCMHAPLMPDNTPVMYDVIRYETVRQTLRQCWPAAQRLAGRMCAVAFGHIHDDLGISSTFSGEDAVIANHGAICRGSLAEVDLNRTIKFAFYDGESFAPVGLKALPLSEIIREEAILKKQQKADAQQFISSLQGVTLGRLTPDSVVAAAKAMDVDEPVLNYIKELMHT